MNATFDKFAWLKAAQSDAGLTDKDFRLAVLIGVTYTRADGTGWAVELDALAVGLCGGLSRRRLADALARLVDRGYLKETSRTGGGRGLTARRSFDLLKPTTPASGVCTETQDASDTGLADSGLWITPETHDATVTGLAETHDASVRNPGRQRPKPLTLASEKVPADLPEGPPTGTSSGTPTGGDEPPPRFCAAHPGGYAGPCGACGTARNERKEWERTHVDRHKTAALSRRAAIDACNGCDKAGLALGPDGVDLDTPRKCDHPPVYAEATR